MTPAEIAEKHTILRSTVGSTIHRLHLEGVDDRDEMGIAIEPLEMVFGLQQFEHYIHRDQPEGVKSQPGDLDLTIYSLRKYVRLAAAGNPTSDLRPEVLEKGGSDFLATFLCDVGVNFLDELPDVCSGLAFRDESS